MQAKRQIGFGQVRFGTQPGLVDPALDRDGDRSGQQGRHGQHQRHPDVADNHQAQVNVGHDEQQHKAGNEAAPETESGQHEDQVDRDNCECGELRG